MEAAKNQKKIVNKIKRVGDKDVEEIVEEENPGPLHWNKLH